MSFPALWFAAAGGFESFIDYLVHYPYLFLSSGSAALYPQNIPWMIPFGGLGLVTLPFVALKHHTLPQKFALMGLLAVLFKYAFTREAPAHLQPLLVTILALGAYLGLQNNRFGMGYAAVLALLFGVQSYFSFGLWMPKTLAVNPIHWRPSKTPLLEPKVARIHDLPDNWRGKIENAICDSYPYDFLYQAAHGLTPEWRWVPQSYVNPHPALDRYTASQWEFHGAPFLLWHSAGTNGRNPQRFVSLNGQYLPNVEPCVFRTLVHQYAPRESHPDVLLLERITAPKTPEERLVETRTIHLNETIDLDPTVHQIRFFLRLTERGKLRSALYKEPPLFIEYHLADGMRFRYRLNRHQTPQGVWINPYFDHPNHTGRPVTGIQIQTAQPNAYARAVELSIFTYPWPPELLERWPFLKEASD
ncbi:hypothetical protein GC167_02630 [bacterium]|nr:hypothetical protein [bacterium]